MKCNRAELADVFGVATATVDKMIADGMPFISRPAGKGKGAWEFDSRRCIDWFSEKRAPDAVKHTEKERAEMRALHAEVTLKEVKAATALRQVVLVSDAVALFEEKAGVVKSLIRAIPGRVATAAAAETDPSKVLVLLKTEVEGALADITVNKLREAGASLAADGGREPEPGTVEIPAPPPVSDELDTDGY